MEPMLPSNPLLATFPSAPRRGGLVAAISLAALPAILLASLLLISATAARAGDLHPAVRAALSKLPPAGEMTVLFIMDRQADVPALDRALTAQHATRAERHRRVIELLRAEAGSSQPSFLEELRLRSDRGEVSSYGPYWITNLVVVRATGAAIEDLAGRSDVAIVEPAFSVRADAPVETRPVAHRKSDSTGIGVAPGLRAINAPRVWYELGINGSGRIVGDLDTGVDGNHPALHDRWRGNNGHAWQECWHDVLGTNTQFPNDGNNHGTHVMGTITGLGAATEDTIGVAWGAEWIAANPINQGSGHELDMDVIDCLQWFADPDGDPGTIEDVPDVVLNAWGINEYLGGSPPYTDCDSRWWPAIDNCEAAGVALLWSAGGDGPAGGTVRSPADRATTPYNCFSIGAVEASTSAFPYPVASFSSRGPSGCNVPAELKIKPEVTAPGVDIYSSVAGGTYAVWSGTAMASSHAAGVVALMRAADPDVEVDTIKQILMSTARDEGPAGEDNSYGWGVIDAYEAVRTLMTDTAVPSPVASPLTLLAVRPNPFSDETALRFRTSEAGPAVLAVFDLRGRHVRTVLSGVLDSGEHGATWDGTDERGRPVPSGVYFCRLTSRDRQAERSILLAR